MLTQKQDAIDFISQAYKHCKPIAFESDADPLIQKTSVGEDLRAKKSLAGIISSYGTEKDLSKDFINAIAQHRFWEREKSPV
jgi:catalase